MSVPYYEVLLDDTVLCTSDWKNGILSPIVEKEINTSGSFSFTATPDCSRISEIKRWTSRITVNVCGQNVFYGRVLETYPDFFNRLSVRCEGALGWLNDSRIYLPASFKFSWELIDIVLKRHREGSTIEPYKYFYVGYAEPESSSGDYASDVEYIPGYIDGNGNYQSDSFWTVSKNFIARPSTDDLAIEDLIAVIPAYRDESDGTVLNHNWVNEASVPSSTDLYAALYDENKNFRSRVTVGAQKISRYAGFYDGMAGWLQQQTYYIKLMSRNYGTMRNQPYEFWFSNIVEYDAATSDDKAPIPVLEDIMTNFVNLRGLMVRSRYKNGRNLIDFLNPNRKRNARSFEITRNIIDLSQEAYQISDPYSVLMPYFNGIRSRYDTDHYVTLDTAVNIYGRILKAVDCGDTVPTTASAWSAIEKKLKQYGKFYNPITINPIIVHGLDGAIFFNDGTDIIDVGDPVHVYSPANDIDRTNICLSEKLDLDSPQNNEYKIGPYVKDGEDARIKTLTESLAKTKKKK